MTTPNRPAPEPVSLGDGQDALERLRARGRVDVDSFLSKLDVTRILHEPIGPTAQCLTLDQLEQYAFGPVIDLPHLAECDSCANALRAYRAVKERSAVPAGNPLGVPVREEMAFGVEVPEVIELGLADLQFDVVLQVDSVLDVQPADLKVANSLFTDIYCKAIDVVDSDAEARWTYRARCVGRRQDAMVRGFEPGAKFVDWIQVSGRNTAGQTFDASDLARFSVSKDVSAVRSGV